MGEYKYDEFWREVGNHYAKDDPLGAVCWDGAPEWFNRFFARCQVRVLERALLDEFGDVRRQGRALDIGCGTGRWTNLLRRWWSDPVGVDVSAAMLASGHPRAPAVAGDASRLPFADQAFDVALSVTVLLHLPHNLQERAVREAARVVKPGGSLVILEMTKRVAERSHVFPRTVAGWQRLLDESGFSTLATFGEAYAPLLRLGFAAAGRYEDATGTNIDAVKRGTGSRSAGASAINRLPAPLKAAARLAVAASYPLERAAAVMPASAALNACLVARRR